jgi:hypothetical protein
MEKNNKKIKINPNVDLSDATLEEMTQVEQDLLVNLAKKKLASKMIEDAYKKHPDWPSPAATMMPVRSTIGYTVLFGNYYLFYLTIPELLDVLLVDNVFYDEKEMKWKAKFKGLDLDRINEVVGLFGDSISFRELFSGNDLYKLMFKFSFVKFPKSPVGLSKQEFEDLVYEWASKPEILKNKLNIIQVLEKELDFHGYDLGAAPFIKFEDIPKKLYGTMLNNCASDIINYAPKTQILDLWKENPEKQLTNSNGFYDYIVDVDELPDNIYFDIRITSKSPKMTRFYWPKQFNKHRGYERFLPSNLQSPTKPKKLHEKLLQRLSPIVKIKTYPSVKVEDVLKELDKEQEIPRLKPLVISYVESLQQKGLIDKLQIEVTLEDMLEETLKEADFVEKVKSRNKTGFHIVSKSLNGIGDEILVSK